MVDVALGVHRSYFWYATACSVKREVWISIKSEDLESRLDSLRRVEIIASDTGKKNQGEGAAFWAAIKLT